MEAEVRKRFERIEATLALTARNHRAAMEALDKRMAAAERRAEAHEKQMAAHEKQMAAHEKQMAAHEKQMASLDQKFDAKLDGIRKLIAVGMRMINHCASENVQRRREIRGFHVEMKEFKDEVRGYIRAQSNGRGRPNGNGRH